MESFDGVSIIEEERGGLERGREGGREEVRKGETDIHVENKIRGYETKVKALKHLLRKGYTKCVTGSPPSPMTLQFRAILYMGCIQVYELRSQKIFNQ